MTDPQTAADAAAEELGTWLAGRTVDDQLGRDLRALLNDRVQMVAELKQVRGERAADNSRTEYATDLLSVLVDPKPCGFNSNDGCQAHGFMPWENCPHAEARAFLAGAKAHRRAVESEHNEKLHAALTVAVELIDRLAFDDDLCEIDHNGYCQTHNLHEAPCPYPLGRQFVETWQAAQVEGAEATAARPADGPAGTGESQRTREVPRGAQQGVGERQTMTDPTRTDVDDAWRELASALHDLACAARDWHTYPNQDVQRCAVRGAFDVASNAFDRHVETLTAWTTGASEDGRG